MSYSEFVKTFTHIEAVHLDSDTAKDEPSLHHKQTWQMRLYQGAWIRGVTAGGCRNNPGKSSGRTNIVLLFLFFQIFKHISNVPTHKKKICETFFVAVFSRNFSHQSPTPPTFK